MTMPGWVEDHGWLQGLLVEGDVRHVGYDFCEILHRDVVLRVFRRSPRWAPQLCVRPTIVLQEGARLAFFDLGEWNGALGLSHEPVEGEDQLGRLEEIVDLDNTQGDGLHAALHQARDTWVRDLGVVSQSNQTLPALGQLGGPSWLDELDERLVIAGFDTGWSDISEAGYRIVVRQRGPLRLQLAVLDGRPSVQASIWPHCSWRPIAIAGEWIGWRERIEHDDFLSVAMALSEKVFSTTSRPQWAAQERLEWAARTEAASGEVGPRKGEVYSEIWGPKLHDWLEAPDTAAFAVAMEQPSTCLGGPEFTVRPASGVSDVSTIPDVMVGSSLYVSDQGAELVPRIAPDAHLFEFSVGGRRFYEVELVSSVISDVTDLHRSEMAGGRPAYMKQVVDPLQIDRPGHVVGEDMAWIADEGVRTEIRRVQPSTEFRATWT